MARIINPPLSRELAQDAVSAIEAAVAAGAVWPLEKGSLERSAFMEASQALGISPSTLKNRITVANLRYGLSPAGIAPPQGWLDRAARPRPAGRRAAKKAEPPASPADPVALQRLKDTAQRLQRENSELARRAGRAENLRESVMGLVAEPLPPVHFAARDRGVPHAETIVLFLSDLHWGERVDLAAMDGLNAYSLDIAAARLGRWAQGVTDLATRHWSGPPPARIILILGGDLVSGEIHAELAKTNEAKALPAVRDLVAHLSEAIRLIRRAVPCPLDIISLNGNHGRSTVKPESKEGAETSYDTLVCDFLEVTLAGEKGVTFYKPPSGDAPFSVYGWTIFATHGDRIGSRGGQGFIGPAATAARGLKRIAADYAARGVILDLILIGHFHTPLQLEEGFVNGSLPGPTEYSRDGRFRPHPAQQLFFTMHPRRKVAQVRWIHVGAPDEGGLYDPPADAPRIRPRYRIKAVTQMSARAP